MLNISPIFWHDFYKVSHRGQYCPGTTKVNSNFTPRYDGYFKGKESELYNHKVVWVGLQYVIKHILIDKFNNEFFNQPIETIVEQYRRVVGLGLNNPDIDTSHIESLHKLGYLPLEIKAIEEGELVDLKIPVLTVENTIDEFFWLTNAIETFLSADLWMFPNNATIAYEYKKLCNHWAKQTCDNFDHIPFQCHDFSYRGMPGTEAAIISGMAHLMSFVGTDTVPAIFGAEYYYNADNSKQIVGCSVPASEHSVSASYGKESEYDMYERFITQLYPSGIVSIVSDTYDFWNVLTNYLPRLKDKILARDGKVVIRPDSGDPVDIICGLSDFTGDKYGCIGATGEFIYDGNVCKFLNNVYDEYVEEYGSNGFEYVIDEYIKILRPVTDAERKGTIELLWDTFGGTINSKGMKVLNPKIGAIYGDSINLTRAQYIFKQLHKKGFASSNIVFGVGSYTYCYNTRDSQGWAMKATYCEIDGVARDIFKEPKTDPGKKSAKGLLRVEKENGKFVLYDQQTREQYNQGELKPVFRDGKLLKEFSLEEIRKKLN